jgi:CDP-diacylglycerol--glycerol-3-phosphate 3-phosphatidyltransferase
VHFYVGVKTNGFWKGQGLSGYIPHAYSRVLQQFYQLIVTQGQRHRIALFEYTRKNWTFHAKGLWLSLPSPPPVTVNNNNNNNNNNERSDEMLRKEDNFPCVTLIGSPNFGVRSIARDVESQLVIITENRDLQQRLQQEMEHIFATAERVSDKTFNESPGRGGGVWLGILVPFAKNFM